MILPPHETQAERDASAARFGAELARLTAAAGLPLPPARRLTWCTAEFEGPPATPAPHHGAEPGPPAPDRARLRGENDRYPPHLTLCRGRLPLAEGRPPDLLPALRAVSAWLAGADLAAIRRTAPFLHVQEWAFTHERTPLDRIELNWRVRMQGLAHGPYPVAREDVKALWEAAFAQPRLRRLRPVTSHYTLWFSSTPDYPFERVGASVEPLHRGGYLVRAGGGEPATVATAAEAVALAVAALPPEPV
ncbi:DUF6193 family natural product biosynthesis protein [Kitasatospora cineracea]|uniref:DUF6193 family natural product biosynthesis protein n=1 Tax=Kitasatospora cineracea TaxID=88074 RepID=UPI003789ABB8